jgi:hypothetical protein
MGDKKAVAFNNKLLDSILKGLKKPTWKTR